MKSRFVAPSDNKTVSTALVMRSRWVRPSVQKTIDLEWVEVYATGLVKPDDPDAKIKFLAAEALRGVGLCLRSTRKRFANELGWRDYVTGEMWQNNLHSASL